MTKEDNKKDGFSSTLDEKISSNELNDKYCIIFLKGRDNGVEVDYTLKEINEYINEKTS